ncbi:hypothetical protein [Tuwongella immobilis]|nr:hypothetical protein [Tuwongella immobilis]
MRTLLGLCLAGMLGLPSGATAAELRAGAVAQDITPTKFPINVNGNMTNTLAKGVTDRLHARCLVLDDGKTTLALVTVDSCMVPREVMDRAKKIITERIGIPASHVLISATHTHTAPASIGLFQTDADPDYPGFLAEKIAAGVIAAHGKRIAAEIGWGVGTNADQVFNRRWFIKGELPVADPFGVVRDRVRMNPGYQNPSVTKSAGPVDPGVSVLAVRTRDGKPLAVYANYSLHYVGGVSALSADYYGMFAERLKALLNVPENDPNFVGIMSNGTSGNINNINYGAPAPMAKRPGEQARIVADSVAQTVVGVLKTMQYRSETTLAAATEEISLSVRKGSAEELQRARELIAASKTPVLQGLPAIYARETVLLDQYPDTVPMVLQAMRIGDVGITAIPCEVFVEIGLEIKAKSPLKPSFTVSLANGYNGYLPTPEHHALGGYETWRARSSYLETGASPKITAVLFRLLDQVQARRQ